MLLLKGSYTEKKWPTITSFCSAILFLSLNLVLKSEHWNAELRGVTDIAEKLHIT